VNIMITSRNQFNSFALCSYVGFLHMLARSGKTLKLNITCDRGHFTADLMVESWQVLTPMPMNQSDFLSYRSRLGGFSKSNADVSASAARCSSKEVEKGNLIEQLVRGRLNLALVATGVVRGSGSGNAAPEEEWQFAGCSRKQMREEQVFVSVSIAR
jgi:hypothetical protein